MNANNPKPIRLLDTYNVFRWYIDGLRYRSITTTLEIDPSVTADLSDLHLFFAELCPESKSIILGEDARETELIHYLTEISASLQRSATIPVFGTCKSTKPDTGSWQWKVSIPYNDRKAAIAALHWSISAFNSWQISQQINPAKTLGELRRFLSKFSLIGTNSFHFAEGAFDDGVPFSCHHRTFLNIGDLSPIN